MSVPFSFKIKSTVSLSFITTSSFEEASIPRRPGLPLSDLLRWQIWRQEAYTQGRAQHEMHGPRMAFAQQHIFIYALIRLLWVMAWPAQCHLKGSTTFLPFSQRTSGIRWPSCFPFSALIRNRPYNVLQSSCDATHRNLSMAAKPQAAMKGCGALHRSWTAIRCM